MKNVIREGGSASKRYDLAIKGKSSECDRQGGRMAHEFASGEHRDFPKAKTEGSARSSHGRKRKANRGDLKENAGTQNLHGIREGGNDCATSPAREKKVSGENISEHPGLRGSSK